VPTSVSISTSLLRPGILDGLGRPLDAKTRFASHGEDAGDGSRLIAFLIRSLNTDKLSRHNKYAETNDNCHHRSHRFPAHVRSPIVSLVAFSFDMSLPIRTGATGNKFSTSINLSPGSFFIRWTQPFQPQALSSSAPVLLHACACIVALSRQKRCARRPRFPRRRGQSSQGALLLGLQI
jgi:hypothetical protein